MFYECEIWPKEEKKIIESFEMCCYRSIQKINRIDRITNKEILERGPKKENIVEKYKEKAKRMDWPYSQKQRIARTYFKKSQRKTSITIHKQDFRRV